MSDEAEIATMLEDDYKSRVLQELDTFGDCSNVHDLPAIFHYWSNSKVRPQLEAFGFSSPQGMFELYLERQCARAKDRTPRFVSIGSGNCDMEVALARHLKAAGHTRFIIDCLDLNPAMLDRGKAAAQRDGVADHLCFLQGDFNEWTPLHEYDAVLASHALHHVVNLEGLFQQVKACLKADGRFVISDMVGRNGHQRWPEALALVRELWRELPSAYRYNRILQRQEEEFVNWDCSAEGFEGIRSQDILPLLLNNFQFELFVAYGNVIDPFTDRSFGHNFDASAAWDRDFIDRVHQRDVEAMRDGRIKPVHMEAVLGKDVRERVLCHEPFTPEFCVRWPNPGLATPIASLEMERDRLKQRILQLNDDKDNLRQKLDLAELRLRLASESRWLKLGRRFGLGPGL